MAGIRLTDSNTRHNQSDSEDETTSETTQSVPKDDRRSQRTVGQLSTGRKVLFSAVTLLAFYSLCEVGLRVTGFSTGSDVETMAFTFPIDDYNNNSPQPFLQRDPNLFWRPIPGVLGHNSHGYFGPEFEVEKPANTFRIVCMGDSCTHFGPTSYPDMLRSFLDQQAPGKFEVINAGVIGFTSHQGRVLLESEIESLRPDLVTIYYGWNDHWLARGFPDRDQQVPGWWASQINRLRTVQFAQMVLRGGSGSTGNLKRVELDDYENNLLLMSQRCHAIGASVCFLTAPHALDLGIPPYLLTSGEVLRVNSLIPMHQRYNQVVRSIAQRQKDCLIDLETMMDEMDKRRLFVDDHIHLTDFGKQIVAKEIADRLVEMQVLETNQP